MKQFDKKTLTELRAARDRLVGASEEYRARLSARERLEGAHEIAVERLAALERDVDGSDEQAVVRLLATERCVAILDGRLEQPPPSRGTAPPVNG